MRRGGESQVPLDNRFGSALSQSRTYVSELASEEWKGKEYVEALQAHLENVEADREPFNPEFISGFEQLTRMRDTEVCNFARGACIFDRMMHLLISGQLGDDVGLHLAVISSINFVTETSEDMLSMEGECVAWALETLVRSGGDLAETLLIELVRFLMNTIDRRKDFMHLWANEHIYARLGHIMWRYCGSDLNVLILKCVLKLFELMLLQEPIIAPKVVVEADGNERIVHDICVEEDLEGCPPEVISIFKAIAGLSFQFFLEVANSKEWQGCERWIVRMAVYCFETLDSKPETLLSEIIRRALRLSLTPEAKCEVWTAIWRTRVWSLLDEKVAGIIVDCLHPTMDPKYIQKAIDGIFKFINEEDEQVRQWCVMLFNEQREYDIFPLFKGLLFAGEFSLKECISWPIVCVMERIPEIVYPKLVTELSMGVMPAVLEIYHEILDGIDSINTVYLICCSLIEIHNRINDNVGAGGVELLREAANSLEIPAVLMERLDSYTPGDVLYDKDSVFTEEGGEDDYLATIEETAKLYLGELDEE